MNTTDYSSIFINYLNNVKQNPQFAVKSAAKTASNDNSDTFLPSQKDSKKAKVAKIALLTATAITVITGVAALISHRGKIKNSFKKFKNIIGVSIEKENEKVKETVENLEAFQGGADNIINGKDVITRKIGSHFGFYRKYDEITTNIYKKSVKNTITGKYNKAQKAFNKFEETLQTGRGKLNETEAQAFDGLFKKVKENILNFSSKTEVSSRTDSLDNSLKGIDKEGFDTLMKKLGEKLEGIKFLLKNNIVAPNVENAAKEQSKLISKLHKAGLSDSEYEEFMTLLNKISDTNPVIKKQAQKTQKTFQKALSSEKGDLLKKLRDINCGSAPTDIMTILTASTALGIYTLQADSKEEKTSVILETGIPLIATLSTTLIATLKMISGARSFLLGIMTGFAAKIAGKAINDKYKQSKNIKETPKTIITIDDYDKQIRNLIKTNKTGSF